MVFFGKKGKRVFWVLKAGSNSVVVGKFLEDRSGLSLLCACLVIVFVVFIVGCFFSLSSPSSPSPPPPSFLFLFSQTSLVSLVLAKHFSIPFTSSEVDHTLPTRFILGVNARLASWCCSALVYMGLTYSTLLPPGIPKYLTRPN